MSQELKPCPFCGAAAWVSPAEDGRFYVACTGDECWAAMGEEYDHDAMPDHHYYSQEAAIAAWNTRSDAHLQRSHEAIERVGERAAREIVGCFDVAPGRGRHYSNSVTQTIAIIIQQQIRAALTEAAALEEKNG